MVRNAQTWQDEANCDDRRTPSHTLGEHATQHWTDRHTDSQGTDDNALIQGHLFEANDVSYDGQCTLEQPSGTEAEECAAKYEDSGVFGRCADNRPNWQTSLLVVLVDMEIAN